MAESSRRLEVSEEPFRGAFERAPIGVALVRLDGSFLLVNGSLCRMLGRSEDELLATTFETITHPDDLERSRQAHRQLMAGDVGALYMERRCVRADGEMFWAQLSASTVSDDRGQPLYWVCHVEDIDQRKRAEVQLRQTERKYRTLVEQVPSVVYTAEYGESGRWYYVSPRIESMLGFTPQEWLADPDLWYEQMVPEDRERALADDAHSRTSGEPLRSEYRLRSRDGRVVWVRDEAEAVLDDEGIPAFHHGILVDITLQKEAKNSIERLAVALERRVAQRTAELEEANRELLEAKESAERANGAKSEFLSRMSHELRTPLNAILGFGQLLETSPLAPDDVESVQQILKGGRHLLDLINEVLDIARIESRNLSLSLEPVSIADVVHEVMDLVHPLAAEGGVQLRTSPIVPARFVLADRQRLKQVMLNLLANAVKYNVQGGSATVSFRLDVPGRVSIGVTDTGPGIAPEHRERLFSPFDRLDAERHGVEGTGLGLALTKALVEAMGGSIGVESEVGRGSSFWVALPVSEAPDAHRDHEEPSPPPAPSSIRGRTVLYIEDNTSNHTLMERVLADGLDVRLLTAMQGRMGFDLAQEHSPDLIVLDLHLPDISGEEVLSRLRGDPVTLETPVIVMSADSSPGQIERLMSAGANEFLPKPLDLKLFLEAVAEVLATPRKPRDSGGAEGV
ncbi:MAG: PAS domain S-box protein [Actinomycetota bacterium]